MSPDGALDALRALGDPVKAAEMAAYHKAPREYLGVSVPAIEALVAEWRATHDVPGLVALAAGLWDSDVHEARVAAAKLLTKARYPFVHVTSFKEVSKHTLGSVEANGLPRKIG